jgi:hypothetical protein
VIHAAAQAATEAECDLCDRPAGTAYVCAPCAAQTIRALRQLADIAGDLQTTIARQGRSGGGSGGDSHPLPVDLGASETAWAVTNTITTWARHCAETRGEPLPAGDLAGAAAWLAGQMEWLRHQPEASEAVDELADACALAVRVVDRRADRWYAGPCVLCTEDLYALPGAATIRCPKCEAKYDAQERRELLLVAAQDRLVHAELIGRALIALGWETMTAARVRGLVRRGKVAERGQDEARRTLYRLGDVVGVMRAQDAMRAVMALPLQGAECGRRCRHRSCREIRHRKDDAAQEAA